MNDTPEQPAQAGQVQRPVVALPTHDEQGRAMGWVQINGHRYWRPVVRVARVTLDGTTCTVPASDLLDVLGDGNEYEVELETISAAEFDRMPEFTGW